GTLSQILLALVDSLPAGDGRAVEHLAFRESVFLDHGDVEGDVLPLAARVSEAEIDIFDVIVLDHLHDILRSRHCLHSPLLWTRTMLLWSAARSHPPRTLRF